METYNLVTCQLPRLHWYFVFENCTDLLYEEIVLVIEKNVCKFDAVGQEFAIFIQTLNGQNIFF